MPEVPNGLRYSERALWDAPAPTQEEMRVVLGRLARTRGAQRQMEAVLRSIEKLVPERHAGMHPSLTELYDMARAMRNYFESRDTDG